MWWLRGFVRLIYLTITINIFFSLFRTPIMGDTILHVISLFSVHLPLLFFSLLFIGGWQAIRHPSVLDNGAIKLQKIGVFVLIASVFVLLIYILAVLAFKKAPEQIFNQARLQFEFILSSFLFYFCFFWFEKHGHNFKPPVWFVLATFAIAIFFAINNYKVHSVAREHSITPPDRDEVERSVNYTISREVSRIFAHRLNVKYGDDWFLKIKSEKEFIAIIPELVEGYKCYLGDGMDFSDDREKAIADEILKQAPMYSENMNSEKTEVCKIHKEY